MSYPEYTVKVNPDHTRYHRYQVGYDRGGVFIAVDACLNLSEADGSARRRNLQLSGANACRNDRVINLTTNRRGTVVSPKQDGRVLVKYDGVGGTVTAERWNIRRLIYG